MTALYKVSGGEEENYMSLRDRVLIVDDQEGIRRLLDEACSLLGYTVVTACSGLEALKLAEGMGFKAALIDMKMPGMNGIETLQKINAIDPEIKLALMTGYGEMQLIEDAVKTSSCRIIRKPFDLDDIRKFLEEIFQSVELDCI